MNDKKCCDCKLVFFWDAGGQGYGYNCSHYKSQNENNIKSENKNIEVWKHAEDCINFVDKSKGLING